MMNARNTKSKARQEETHGPARGIKLPPPPVEKTRLLEEGGRISDTYQVERFIAEGAFGEVYRVRHRFLGRQAMKVFKLPDMPLDEVHGLLGEAFMLSRIAHPNIISVFDAGLTATSRGQCPYFTMEFVAGGTLHDYWKSFGSSYMPVEKAVEVMTQVCRGLTVAHSHKPPVVHRDIKPQNILIGYDGSGLRARIADFGLAKQANPLTLAVTAHGTLAFKAPEVFDNPKGDSCAGDVWAAGCSLYLLLTDRLPWRGSTGAAAETASRQAGYLAPSKFNLMVDRSLDRIVAKALAWDPAKRHPDSRALLAELEAWKPGERQDKGEEEKEDYVASTMLKTALGPVTSLDETSAQKMVSQALRLSRDPRRLIEAADLLEEAFKDVPALRDRYGYRVQLWRRGLVM